MNMSQLYKDAQVLEVFKELGFTDIEAKSEIHGIQAPFYSKEK